MYQIVMIAGVFAIMYFMVIRPQKKRQQELSLMRENLSVGDEVVTIGGIVGKVTLVTGDEFNLLTANETTMQFKKTAVAIVEPKEQPEIVAPVDNAADATTPSVEDDGIRDQETEIKE